MPEPVNISRVARLGGARMIALTVMLLGAIGGALGVYGCYRQWQRQIAEAKRRHRDEIVERAMADYRRDAA